MNDSTNGAATTPRTVRSKAPNCAVDNINWRREAHGDDQVGKVDVSLSAMLRCEPVLKALWGEEAAGKLREALWDDVGTARPLHTKPTALRKQPKFGEQKVRIVVAGTPPRTVKDAVLAAFKFEARDGFMLELSWQVQLHATESMVVLLHHAYFDEGECKFEALEGKQSELFDAEESGEAKGNGSGGRAYPDAFDGTGETIGGAQA